MLYALHAGVSLGITMVIIITAILVNDIIVIFVCWLKRRKRQRKAQNMDNRFVAIYSKYMCTYYTSSKLAIECSLQDLGIEINCLSDS